MSWEVLNETVVVDSPPWIRVTEEKVRLHDGKIVESFFRVEQPPFALIFAVTKDGKVPFITQYKHGPRARSMELPAGYIEPGEDPLESAKRELLEETGLIAAEWKPLGAYFLDGNRWCGQSHMFLALEAERAAE